MNRMRSSGKQPFTNLSTCSFNDRVAFAWRSQLRAERNVSMGARRHGQGGTCPPSPENVVKCFVHWYLQQNARKTIYLWIIFTIFRRLYPGPRWGTFVSRPPNLPTPGKNPAGSHGCQRAKSAGSRCIQESGRRKDDHLVRQENSLYCIRCGCANGSQSSFFLYYAIRGSTKVKYTKYKYTIKTYKNKELQSRQQEQITAIYTKNRNQ